MIASDHLPDRLAAVAAKIRALLPDDPQRRPQPLWAEVLACVETSRVRGILRRCNLPDSPLEAIESLHAKWIKTAQEVIASTPLETPIGLDPILLQCLYPTARMSASQQPRLLARCRQLDPKRLAEDVSRECRRLERLVEGCISDRLIAARRIRQLGLGLSDQKEALPLLAPLVPLAAGLLYDENISVWRTGASAFGSLAALDHAWDILERHLSRKDANIHRQRHAFAALGSAIRIPTRRESVLKHATALFRGPQETTREYNKRRAKLKLDDIWIMGSFVFALPDMQEFDSDSAMHFLCRINELPLTSDEHKRAVLGNLAAVARDLTVRVRQSASATTPELMNTLQQWSQSPLARSFLEGPLPIEPFNRCEAIVRRRSALRCLAHVEHAQPGSPLPSDPDLAAALAEVTKAGEAARAAFVDGSPFEAFSPDPCIDVLADLRFAIQQVFSDGTLLASRADHGDLDQGDALAQRFDQILSACRELILSIMNATTTKLPAQPPEPMRALYHGVQCCCVLMLGDVYDALRDRKEYLHVFRVILPFVRPEKATLVHKYVAATVARCLELTWRSPVPTDDRVKAIRDMAGRLREQHWSEHVQKESMEFIKDLDLQECLTWVYGRPRLHELCSVAGVFEGADFRQGLDAAWGGITANAAACYPLTSLQEDGLTGLPDSFQCDSRHLLRDRWLKDLDNPTRQAIHAFLLDVASSLFARVVEPAGMAACSKHLARLFCVPVVPFACRQDALHLRSEGILGAFLNPPTPNGQATDRLLSGGILLPRCLHSWGRNTDWNGGPVYPETCEAVPDGEVVQIRFIGNTPSSPCPWLLIIGLIQALAQERDFPCRRFLVCLEAGLEPGDQQVIVRRGDGCLWQLDGTNPLVTGEIAWSDKPQKVGCWLHLADRLLCSANKAWRMEEKDGTWQLCLTYRSESPRIGRERV